MGTHGALLVRSPEGMLTRWEQTGDGDGIVDSWRKWAGSEDSMVDRPSEKFGWSQNPEVNGEGEGDQKYYAIVDFERKQYSISWGIGPKDYELMKKLELQGWSIIPESSNLFSVMACPYNWQELVTVGGKLK